MITIQTNNRGQRILMLDSAYKLDENYDFTADMFDAVFVYTSSPEELKTIMDTVNPITSNKCCYKPFLALKSVKGKIGEYAELVDFYTYDINDTDTLDIVDETISKTVETGLSIDDSSVATGNLLFIRLCRYLISRGRTRFEPVLQESSSLGYVIPIFELFSRKGVYQFGEYVSFYQSMLEKGYIKVVRFINKIYLCPKCLHSHLLYLESCPRCHNSDIKSESVIHHFRCANISPEHTYNFGGQLRCPKCHLILRHIGVDYDRPSIVYTCGHCDNMFLQPQMSAVCTSCKTQSEVSRLMPYDITVFELTQLGKEVMVSPNIGFTVYADFYDNYMDYYRFIGRMRLLWELRETGHDVASGMRVARIWVLNENEDTCVLQGSLIALFCKRFPTRKISSANNMIYVKGIVNDQGSVNTEDLTTFKADIEEVLLQAACLLHEGERICYAFSTPTGSVDEFVAKLNYIETYPDKEINAIDDEHSRRVLNAESFVGTSYEHVQVDATSEQPTEEEERIKTEKRKKREREEGLDAMSPQTKWNIIWLMIALTALFVALGLYIKSNNFSSKGPADMDKRAEIRMKKIMGRDVDAVEMENIAETNDTVETPVPAIGHETVMDNEFKRMHVDEYYVVSASFKSEERVRKYMDEHRGDANLNVYHYGRRYIISPFKSYDRQVCEKFILNNKQYADCWIATRGEGVP